MQRTVRGSTDATAARTLTIILCPAGVSQSVWSRRTTACIVQAVRGGPLVRVALIPVQLCDT
jgi:hypothetical protein